MFPSHLRRCTEHPHDK
ncbi:hypothetical protein CFC21_004479, partial [Triticum aestivum]